MIKILITILLLICPTLVFALTIENPDGVFHQCSAEYNFLNASQDLKHIPPGSIVCRASLNQEKLDSHLFSDDMVGVIFIEGNLDNVFIPIGNTLIGTSHLRIMTIEGIDWVVNENNEPLRQL